MIHVQAPQVQVGCCGWMLLVPQVQVQVDVEEGGSGLTLTSETTRVIGQQMIWNPPTVSSSLLDGWGSIVLVFLVDQKYV